MPPISRKHLQFGSWPEEDRALWAAAFIRYDVFDDDCGGAHLAVATRVGLRTALARFLGFLSSEDPERLRLAPDARVNRESIAAYVVHLRKSCRETTVVSTLHMLRQALQLMYPAVDWSWLKTIAKRIDAHAKPLPKSGAVTSGQLFAIGLRLMADAENAALSEGRISIEHALAYRDGLIIALLTAVPLRRRTLAALTIDQHLVKIGDDWLLDIPAADTKTRRPLELPIPSELSGHINCYIGSFRNAISGATNHQGLWPSAKGHPMHGGTLYDMVCRRTKVATGIPVNLHRFRTAAGNLWCVADPTNVRGVKDLLGHADFGTTEKHYIAAWSRTAGRALERALRLTRKKVRSPDSDSSVADSSQRLAF